MILKKKRRLPIVGVNFITFIENMQISCPDSLPDPIPQLSGSRFCLEKRSNL